MEIASLGFRTDVQVLALGGSEVDQDGSAIFVSTPANPGFWWGNFMLLRKPPRAGDGPGLEARFRERFPDARHLAIGIDSTDGECGDRQTLTELGLGVERLAVMTATEIARPAEIARPTGSTRPAGSTAQDKVTIRPLAGDADWQSMAALRAACSELPVTQTNRTFLAHQVNTQRMICEHGDGVWMGALAGGSVVAALGLVRTDPHTARYQNVETHPQLRRRGFATELLIAAADFGREHFAAEQFVIVADPDYHAIKIYERLGFKTVEQQVQLSRAAS